MYVYVCRLLVRLLACLLPCPACMLVRLPGGMRGGLPIHTTTTCVCVCGVTLRHMWASMTCFVSSCFDGTRTTRNKQNHIQHIK